MYIFLERLDQTAKDISSFQRRESRIEIIMLLIFGNSRLRAPAQRARYFWNNQRKWRSDFRRLSTNTSHLLRDIMDSRKCCIEKEELWTAPCVYISPTRHSKIKRIQIENEQPSLKQAFKLIRGTFFNVFKTWFCRGLRLQRKNQFLITDFKNNSLCVSFSPTP